MHCIQYTLIRIRNVFVLFPAFDDTSSNRREANKRQGRRMFILSSSPGRTYLLSVVIGLLPTRSPPKQRSTFACILDGLRILKKVLSQTSWWLSSIFSRATTSKSHLGCMQERKFQSNFSNQKLREKVTDTFQYLPCVWNEFFFENLH